MEKFRWKLEPSSIASQRQNSTYGNTSSVFSASVSFFSVSRTSRQLSPCGTSSVCAAETPFFCPSITL